VSDAETELDVLPDYRSLDVIAELGWQAHIAWERIIGEQPKPDYNNLSNEHKDAVCRGVQWIVEHPTSSIATQHDAWRSRMASGGIDDHPNMVPFDELPFSQQMKARLWRHVVFAVLG
jgi:hypothetical protein